MTDDLRDELPIVRRYAAQQLRAAANDIEAASWHAARALITLQAEALEADQWAQ